MLNTPRPSESSVEPPDGFLYVPQENYFIANLDTPTNPFPTYLYSDSATSCIIVIVVGRNKHNDRIVALSHLGNVARFKQFFKIVAENFVGPTSVYAQGANPPRPSTPDEDTSNPSLINIQQVMQWLQGHTLSSDPASQPFFIQQCSLSFGQGLPQQNNQDCYGINLTTLEVSNQRFALNAEQRDPTGGLQTLYCIFGREVTPPMGLLCVGQPISPTEIEGLVAKAKAYQWTRLLLMSQTDILNQLSSTPKHEVPWFVETLQESAEFVKNYVSVR